MGEGFACAAVEQRPDLSVIAAFQNPGSWVARQIALVRGNAVGVDADGISINVCNADGFGKVCPIVGGTVAVVNSYDELRSGESFGRCFNVCRSDEGRVVFLSDGCPVKLKVCKAHG